MASVGYSGTTRLGGGLKGQIGLMVITALGALAMLLAGPSAHAADEGEVAVGGVEILTIRFPAAGMSVRERADAITERLRGILSNPDLRGSDIVALPFGRDAARILVNGQLLVTVEPQTARFNHATAIALARMWANHLRTVLPQVNVRPNPNLRQPASTPEER